MMLKLIFLIAHVFMLAECANILFFIGFGGQSHRIAMEPLANTLTDKGHQVTFLVQEKPFTHKNQKIKYFVSEKVEEFFKSLKGSENDIDFYEIRKQGKMWQSRSTVAWYGVNVCNALYNDPVFLELIQTVKFDLVFIDGLFSECGYGLAHIHQAKVILFVVSSVPPWIVDGVGIPDESSSIPDMQFGLPQEMNFVQRLTTAVIPVFWKLYREWHHFPQLEKITNEGIRSFKKTSIPSFTELERQVDLVFVNTHVAQEYPRSLPPNVIAIGGISWSEERSSLPTSLEAFINKSQRGFVYVNFGSFIDFTLFPATVQQTFLNVLSNFSDYQFIWKMRMIPDNLPENVYVQKWMPQQDILFHPKIKVFITHSGLGSVNEAIYGSVPLLCFPVFADQDYNARLVESKGMGQKMEITNLTEEGLRSTLSELLLNNNKYRDNMKRINKQFLDRPIKAVDEALWWTEYVLRNDAMDFRKPFSIYQSWWVKRQIDVWIFISLTLITSLAFGVFLMWKLLLFLYIATVGQIRFEDKVNTKRYNRKNQSKYKRN